jgi:hypothetical protein
LTRFGLVQAASFGDASGWRGMLVVEPIAQIRREHFVQGKSIKEIVRDLKMSRNTVRKVLRSGATSFDYAREVQPRPKLGPCHADLDRCFRAGLMQRNAAHLTNYFMLPPDAVVEIGRQVSI